MKSLSLMDTRTMKFRPIFLIALLGFICTHPLSAQESDDLICNANNSVFLPGETITYEIFYNWNFVWISAGEVEFQVASEGDEFKLQAIGRTYPSYEWFFKVRDTFISITDKTELLPKETIRVIHEGSYNRYDHAVYDRPAQKATSNMGKLKGDTTMEEVDINSCTHDILSVVYLMRNMDFDRKGDLALDLYLDRKLYPINIDFNGKKKKKIKGWGKCKTLKFMPQLVVGEVFKEDKGMEVYVSDDKNKIPLLIESPVSVGSVKAVLKSYKGLKYPLEI